MTRTFRSTAARDGFKITVVDDSLLVSMLSNGNAILSSDPAETIAKNTSPAAASETDSILAFFVSFSSSQNLALPVQLRKGQIVYLSTDSAGWCQLIFDLIPAI